ncbi:efflux RND transporter periplasmic adaptor subunit [Methylotenera mobilis]|uniref:Efflux transporter, RND family, MFP subunit n=1 Tax=Methylotenera mobilis (strain JLW8 / ATCC BAA-1282 / DSM 17540) TaxID=583345 RepID=C6WYM3_METML|nr:efflux RND transporter periplasmic adaptor subunit [Methylotenera mobilis]ACT46998.1 efflux transporter, RND family, MFP subunit [Methylotenera mobilis JLW8]
MLSRKLISASVIGLSAMSLFACSEKTPDDPRTQIPLVKTTTVNVASEASRSFTGVVAARVQSDLAFRVSGKILERLVDSGQQVKRGQPLFRIDPNDLKLTALSQKEVVMAAKARADQTAEDEIRHRGLVEAGAVSASVYDQIKSAADSAKAQLKAAESQADVAKNASNYAVLVADADGVVVETLAEPGQVVNAGQAVARVAHAGKREAIVHLPETLRPALGTVAQAKLYGNGSKTVPAKLRQLSESADALSRTYEARYTLSEGLADAPLGSTVTIQLNESGSTAATSIEVPIGAIFDSGKESGVWVVEGKPLHVSWRPVKLISISEESARIDSNLKLNEQIVALGAHLLHQGEKVRVATDSDLGADLKSGEEK